jgi:hypothetical protein
MEGTHMRNNWILGTRCIHQGRTALLGCHYRNSTFTTILIVLADLSPVAFAMAVPILFILTISN